MDSSGLKFKAAPPVDGHIGRAAIQCTSSVPRLDLTSPKKLAHINGQINQMTKDQIIQELQRLRLNCQGNKDKVKKRLKNHFKKQRAFQLARQPKQLLEYDRNYDYLCVLDFECTCEEGIYDYAHEIIEFPVVLLKTKTLEVVDEFHSYCRPILHPTVTPFCTNLTGITQEQVDNARPFLDVLDDFQSWLDLHKLGTENRYAIVADGPWDMGKFFQMQCLISGLPSIPHQYRYWINIRRSFANLYSNPSRGKKAGNPHDWKNLEGMLSAFEMEFEGRAHCGRDDARNIARVVKKMLKDGCDMRINERLLRRDRALCLNEKRQKKHEEKEKKAAAAGQLRGSEANGLEQERTESPSGKEKDAAATAKKPEKPLDPEEAERLERENKERQVWRDHLPYKVVSVSKQEFIMDLYAECMTCSEPDSDIDIY